MTSAELVLFPGKRKPRELTVAFKSYERWFYMGRQPKLTLTFTIMDAPDFGRDIQAHYRLERFDGRKRCFAAKRSRIVLDLGRLFPDYVDEMPLPLSKLKGIHCVCRTRWVTENGQGVQHAPQHQYEVIDHLLGIHHDP